MEEVCFKQLVDWHDLAACYIYKSYFSDPNDLSGYKQNKNSFETSSSFQPVVEICDKTGLILLQSAFTEKLRRTKGR